MGKVDVAQTRCELASLQVVLVFLHGYVVVCCRRGLVLAELGFRA